MRVASVISAVVGLLMCTGELRAQGTEIVPGARLRIAAQGIVAGQLVATVLSRTADSLVLGGPGMQPLTVAVNRLTSIEVSRGKSRLEGAGRGIKWGVPISVGLASLIAPTLKKCDTIAGVRRCGLEASTGDKWAFALVGGTVAGIFYGVPIGALIGAERWERFEPVARTSFIMHQGSPGIGMSVSF